MLLLFIDTILSSFFNVQVLIKYSRDLFCAHSKTGPEVHKPQLFEGDIQILISNLKYKQLISMNN